MELTTDLIAIQSILSNLIKNTGEFTRINYRGGNEDTILTIMIEIQKYLKSKNYITKDNKPNEIYNKQLEDIVLFLALNTTFKDPLKLEDYAHLMNITPPLSKCIFVNIVYGLDLCKYYCNVINIFPISLSTQLLDEVLHCLKKSTPTIQLEHTNMFLKAVANKLFQTNYCPKVEDDISNICEVTEMILFNLSGVHSSHLQTLNKEKIYKHMGFCLLNLFELLLICDQNCLSLRQFIGIAIKTCCSIVKNITIDVFCVWAEVSLDDEGNHLQTAVANKAYLFIETYKKYSGSSELISMLGCLAKKPKSLTEQIYEADVETMIKKINNKDENQISWFKALLRTQIYENKKSIECIRTLSHLSSENDVSILLNWCIQHKNKESVELFIKCASHLSLEELKTVVTTHFYKNKFFDLTTNSIDIEKKLTWILNKLKGDTENLNELTKEILLLFLQQPLRILAYLYQECLKNGFYTNILKGTFETIKEIIKINDTGVESLLLQIKLNIPNSNDVDNYIALLKILLEINYFNNEDVLLKILSPLLKDYFDTKSLKEIYFILQIFLGVSLTFLLKEDNKESLKLILTVMNQNRCKFLDFDGIKQKITKHCVDICQDICKPTYNCEMDIDIENEDDFTQYYKLSLTSGQEISIFRSLFNCFNIDNYANCVNTMLKVLPPAVTREWLAISEEIINVCGKHKCMELFTDIMVLLSQLVETQDKQNISIFLALKYCVQNYGLIIQQKVLTNSTLEEEVTVNKQICRLLSKLPNCLKEAEGLSLMTLLTDRSLKYLVKDKDFICQLILIKNPQVCQKLAQKMTE